jgi:hypothetical protein
MSSEGNYILVDRETTRWRKYIHSFIPSDIETRIVGDPFKSFGIVLSDRIFAYDW